MADIFNISDVPPSGTPQGCRLTNSTATNVPSVTATAIPFDGEDYDTDGMHDNAVNNTRITINTNGKYSIGGQIEWETAGSGQWLGVFLRLNGVTVIGWGKEDRIAGGAGDENASLVNVQREFVAGDFVELMAFRDGGPAALDVLVTADYSPRFWAHRLS